MRKTTIILSNIIAGLIVMCGYLYFQLQEARTERHIIENECGTWVSWEVYQDVVHRLKVSDALIFYVEEVLDDPYIEDYLDSEEREEWAKYH